MTTKIKKINKIYEWIVIKDNRVIAGGFSRTRKYAKNDAKIFCANINRVKQL